MQVTASWWMWTGFIGFILVMLALDLFVLGGRRARKVPIKEALAWWLTWVFLAIVFNLLLWAYYDAHLGSLVANQKALEFFTGYLIEESLSVDNMFVFLMIFTYFAVPPQYQRRVLLYGVLGAIIMRAIMILGGIYLVSKFYWILYFFGGFLIFTGVRMFRAVEHGLDIAHNPILVYLKKHLRITETFCQEKFFIVKKGLLFATPLFLVLIMIELSDLIFALDSIPAIFAITHDPYIIFTSNIFAILGLRALYFMLADLAYRFTLLKYGLAIVLIFVGTKMLIVDFVHVPILLALGFIATVIAISILISLWHTKPY